MATYQLSNSSLQNDLLARVEVSDDGGANWRATTECAIVEPGATVEIDVVVNTRRIAVTELPA